MKKKRVGVVASSVAAIAVCTSVIAGSTYALFTSEDSVNIAVTSGKVSITATVKEGESKSTLGGSAMGAFTNTDGVVAIKNIAPCDEYTFSVHIENNSTIKTAYRTKIELSNDLLASALDITVGGATYGGLTSYTSAWAPLDAEVSPEQDLEVKLAFPDGQNQNKYQDLTTDITVTVEGVQANAGADDSDREFVFSVATAEQLEGAVGTTVASAARTASADSTGVRTTVNLMDDIVLTKELYINGSTADFTLNGNGHEITADAKAFKPVQGKYQLVKINNTESNITFNNVTLSHVALEQNVDSYHTLDVYGASNVALNGVTLIRNFNSAMGGAPLVLNASTVKASNLKLVAGGSAWYGANVDANAGEATLILSDGFTYVDYDNEKPAAVFCEHGGAVTDNTGNLGEQQAVFDPKSGAVVGYGFAVEHNKTVVVSNTEEAQAALDNATEGDTIIFKAFNYGKLYIQTSDKSVALDKYKDNYDTSPAHKYPVYVRTIKNLTLTGEEGAVLNGLAIPQAQGEYFANYCNSKPEIKVPGTVDTYTRFYPIYHLENIVIENFTVADGIDLRVFETSKIVKNVYEDFTDDCYIEGLTLRNLKTTADDTHAADALVNKLLTVKSANDVVIENCEITNRFQGVYCEFVNNIKVINNKFTNLTHNAFGIGRGVAGEIVFSDNTVKNLSDRVMRFSQADTTGVNSILDKWHVVITGNIMIDCGNSGDIAKADGALIKMADVYNVPENFTIRGNYWCGYDATANGYVDGKSIVFGNVGYADEAPLTSIN